MVAVPSAASVISSLMSSGAPVATCPDFCWATAFPKSANDTNAPAATAAIVFMSFSSELLNARGETSAAAVWGGRDEKYWFGRYLFGAAGRGRDRNGDPR